MFSFLTDDALPVHLLLLCSRMIDAMAPHVYGQSMAGAGGGGFMYVVAKKPESAAMLEEIVRSAVSGIAAEEVAIARVACTNHGYSAAACLPCAYSFELATGSGNRRCPLPRRLC